MSGQNSNTFPLQHVFTRLCRWAFNDNAQSRQTDEVRVEPLRAIPFLALHLACFAVFWVGISPVAVVTALIAYGARMFFITGFYHRYFAHRSFQAGRVMSFLMAALGCTAGQRGPLWWTAHHRTHHAQSDTEDDPHSPRHKGFLHSHLLWFFTNKAFATQAHRVRDWLAFPELKALERVWWIPFIGLALASWALGEWLAVNRPALGTSGAQMFVWVFCISTVALYHATYSINSLAHRWGYRRFDTQDDSRNSPALALITLGEGWHNNHHRYSACVRQGFYAGEIDISYYLIKLLALTGMISNLRPVPAKVLAEGRQIRSRS